MVVIKANAPKVESIIELTSLLQFYLNHPSLMLIDRDHQSLTLGLSTKFKEVPFVKVMKSTAKQLFLLLFCLRLLSSMLIILILQSLVKEF